MRSYGRLAGTLLFVGSTQFIIVQIICEALISGYSTHFNFISDLGVWSQPTASPFNASIILLGTTVFSSAYLLKKHLGFGRKAYLLALSGVGAIGVGVFPEDTFIVGGVAIFHGASALLAFIVGAIAAIATYTYAKPPFKHISATMGAATLVGAFLFIVGEDMGYFGLGLGGMERMVTYPLLLWLIAFGGYLLGSPEEKQPT